MKKVQLFPRKKKKKKHTKMIHRRSKGDEGVLGSYDDEEIQQYIDDYEKKQKKDIKKIKEKNDVFEKYFRRRVRKRLVRYNRTEQEICAEDNHLLNMVMFGKISKPEYERRKKQLHEEWDTVQQRENA